MTRDGKQFVNPFPRPWMRDQGAAAAPSGNTGVKGIIAGTSILFLNKNRINFN